MRRIAVAVLAAVVAFGLTAGVMAKEGGDAPKATKIVGQLTKIDGKSLTITTKDGDKTKDTVVTVTDTTKVTQQGEGRKGEPAKVEDLKVGQHVTAFYKADNTLTAIMIMKAAAK